MDTLYYVPTPTQTTHLIIDSDINVAQNAILIIAKGQPHVQHDRKKRIWHWFVFSS